jgi:hypothetical protein
MGSKWILGILTGRVWSGFTCLRIGIIVGCCEYGDEPLGFVAMELVS